MTNIMFENIISSERFSIEKLAELRAAMSMSYSSVDKSEFSTNFLDNICVFACGSLGRLEMAQNSDLDLFFINTSNINISNLDKYLFFSKLNEINNKLGFKKPSKSGLYLEFHSENDLLDIGSQCEDFNNCFTARLLLILESSPILNDTLYHAVLENMISKYCRDYPKHSNDFFPLFLINDILRYWYTLTLNYEFRRDSNDSNEVRYWKRLKLKYPRLLTCYATIACLFKNNITPEYFKTVLSSTPLKRLDIIADKNEAILKIVEEIKFEYDWFLSLKKENSTWWNAENKTMAFKRADNFHNLVAHKLIAEISKSNIQLKMRLDI